MGNEQIALSFGRGITNVPGDATCDDNELEDCVGMVFADGEHRVVQRPVEVLSGVDGRLLYIHRLNNARRYIVYRTVEGSKVTKRLSWSTEDGHGGLSSPYHDLMADMGEVAVRQVTSIGKTLIVSTSEGTRYFLWKDDAYIVLSDDIPMPDIEFRLVDCSISWWDDAEKHPEYQGVTMHLDTNGTISNELLVHANQQSSWNNIVVGLYSRNKKMAADNGRFVNPFFVRAAVKMYDGSYTRMTAPVLMVPNMRSNSHGEWHHRMDDDGDHLWLHTYSCRLQYKLHSDYSDEYQDLVEGVELFVTDEIETMDVVGDIPNMETLVGKNYFDPYFFQNIYLKDTLPSADDFDKPGYFRTERWIAENEESDGSIDGEDVDGGYNSYSHDVRMPSLNAGLDKSSVPYHISNEVTRQERIFTTLRQSQIEVSSSRHLYGFIRMPLCRSDVDIKRDIEEASVFYKLAEIGRTGSNGWEYADKMMRKYTLTNITTQPQLDDEYFGHSRMTGGYAYVYNSRLNLSDVTRTLFNGFSRFMPYDGAEPKQYVAYVTIATESGSFTVKQTYETREKQGIWFYYPDARAKHVQIWRGSGSGAVCVLDAELKEHSGLNGAYYFRGLPADEEYTEESLQRTLPAGYDDAPVVVSEDLTNVILVSEVDNPFVFKSAGYVKVGVGRVLAMSTITQAISQGQFGGFPLVAFSDNGVWALSVADTGIISGAAPKERDVISVADSVTQSDDAVFFVSERGLMAVVSSGNSVAVRCLSEQLSGKNNGVNIGSMSFPEYLRGCVMAYDYRDSLLWIINPNTGFEEHCWLYSIKSGTFSKFLFEDAIENVVNDYPDYLMQDRNGKVYSLLKRPNINADGKTISDSNGDVGTVGGEWVANRYSARMVTRPMKFSNAMALKSIRQIRCVKDMEGTVSYRLLASDTLKAGDWVELGSLRGKPWKYFKLCLDFVNMKATDRFAGTVIVTQERRASKLR